LPLCVQHRRRALASRDVGNSQGKRGGIRVIYTTRLSSGAVVLLIMYAKSAEDNIPSHVLRQIAEVFGYATH
jgi:hypothetical protein